MKKIISMACTFVMIVTALTGCGTKEAPSTAPVSAQNPATTEAAKAATPEAKSEDVVKESPDLVKLVSEGKLPPLEERLPKSGNEMVERMESIGQYGGDLRTYWAGKESQWTAGQMTEEAMFRFLPDGSGVEPNVAKSVDINADSTEFIIHLREGMKWSDGVPFTADDVVFYYDHMLSKETFGKKLYDCYYSVDPATGEKTAATVTKVDDYTVKVAFKNPNVMFLERMAIDNKWFHAPKHYHEKILPEFVGDAEADKIAKEKGFSDAKAMMKETGYYYWVIPEIPTLRAWVATNDPNSDLFIMTRNPYYFKVDEEGKQLPYINNLKFTRMADQKQGQLKILAGEVDLRHVDSQDFTILKENEAKGNYSLLQWGSSGWTGSSIQLNQSVKDDDLRALYQDIRFREAISIAVDRVELTEIMTDGLSEPGQASVPEGLLGYDEDWTNNKWTKYDVEGAKKILDEIGMKVGSDGYRTLPNGKPFIFAMQSKGASDSPYHAKLAELLMKYYKAIGLNCTYKEIDRSLLADMVIANEHNVVINGTGGLDSINLSLRPDNLVPVRVLSEWIGEYGKYGATGGKEGPTPPENMLKLLDYWAKIKSATDKAEVEKNVLEIINLHKENQWVVGFSKPLPALIVKSNRLMNVPEYRIMCDEFRSMGFINIAQTYFKD